MNIMKINLIFTSGKRENFDTESIKKLPGIDKNREAAFLFKNGQIFVGYSDGKVDEDGYFCLNKPDKVIGAALPFKKLLAWHYK